MNQTRVLAAAVLGSSMAFIDGSVVNVALPAIEKSLAASLADMQWVINAYLLLLGALVLLGGSLGDRLGRRKIFVRGIWLFATASAACAAAPGPLTLIVARAVQGVGAALLVPSSLAIIGASFPADARGRAIGTWAGASALTTALGPVLGGWLVDAVSWRAIFLINLPLAAATLWLARAVPDSRDADATGRLDVLGAALVAAGLAAMIWGLIAAPARGFTDPAVIAAIAAGGLLLGAFLAVEARTASPMVPLDLFAKREFAGVNLLTLLLYFALIGMLVFLPYVLIQQRGYTAVQAGAALLPLSLLLGLLSRPAGRLADRIGARILLVAGPAIAAFGLLLLGLLDGAEGYARSVLPGVLLIGAGMTLAVAPLTTVVLASVDPSHAGVASGINNAIARIAGLLATAVLGVLFAAAGFQAVAIVTAGCAAASAVVGATTIGRRP